MEKINKILKEYGIDEASFSHDGINYSIENQIVDKSVFVEKTDWHDIQSEIEIYMIEGYLNLSPKSREENERMFDEGGASLDKKYEIEKKLNNEIEEAFFEMVERDKENEALDLQEKLPEIFKKYISAKDLSSVERWKVPIIIGNSLGSDSPKVGELDKVGYVHVGLKTKTIAPIARGDEHNRGYDLISVLIDKGAIPEDDYIPLFFDGDYASPRNKEMLAAMKIWRELGGPNITIENGSRGDSYTITLDDYIRLNGNIVVIEGELLPVGAEFVSVLKKTAAVCAEARANPNRVKKLKTQIKALLRFIERRVDLYRDMSELYGELNEEDDIQKLEEFVFGFNGIKNYYHQKIRAELEKESFLMPYKALFGDLKLANAEFGRI